MHLLIVDDQPRNLFALEKVLSELPANIVRASSGDEALALALKYRFGLAILDVQMPGMDGFELAELLLGNPETASLPIIFMSAAFSDDEHRFKGYASGAVDYLVKPVDPKVLLGKTRVFLELARARSALEGLVRQRTSALEAKGEQLSRRSRFKVLLSEVSRDIVRKDPIDVRQAVSSALERVAAAVGAPWAKILFRSRDEMAPLAVSADLGWRAAGRPPLGSVDALVSALLGRAGRDGVCLPGPSALGAGAEGAAAHLAEQGVGPLLVLPMLEEQRPLGAVLFAWGAEPGAEAPRDDLAELLELLPELILGSLQRAKAQLLRAESEAQLRLLYETLDQGVVFQTAGGAVLSANPAAERILGMSCGELAQVPADDPRWRLLQEDGVPLPAGEHPTLRALKTGQPVAAVTLGVFNSRDADYRWVQVQAVPLMRPGEHAPFQVYTILSDVTDLRRATAEKERLVHVEAESRAKSGFLASMSHEIRTPMNAILGYTQLLLREPSLSGRQRDYLETMDRSGEHLVTLVNNVLDMARIEAGKDTLEPTRVDFDALLFDVERMFRLRASEKRLQFRVDHAPGPRLLRLDAGKVRQVLINLLGNAMKFTDAGEIVLRASMAAVVPGRVRLAVEVQDSGSGIPSDRLHDVFEPFVQVARSTASVGTGLGLAVCRRFARLMGGDVTVRSSLGAGSTFRFEFDADLASADEVLHTPRQVVGMEGAPVHVLVVEDDADNRAVISTMLRSVGLEVTAVTAAPQALEAFQRAPAGLVLTDMRMPGADGLDVLRGVRALPGGREVPVVAISASTMKDERERALAAGVDAFLAKPLRESSLFSTISSLTGAHFTYAEDGPRRATAPLSAEAVEVLTGEQRSALVAALESGDADAIGREIDAVGAREPVVAGELRRLAEDFEYRRLLGLLQHGS